MSSTVVAAISTRARVLGMPLSPKTHDDPYSTPTARKRVRPASASPHLDDGHVSGHNGAEILAHIIVSRRLGFDTTHLVRSSRHDAILPWWRVPDIRPPPP